ncbi:MAG: energy transducer TonB [Acidobacteria bacterium]|nr:energy transducer TonB [Acidobacteriota bacterium]MBI3426970.1 energy transducer TonB [Acidobacteriota bacterium]
MSFNRENTIAGFRVNKRQTVLLTGVLWLLANLLLLTQPAVQAVETVEAGNLNGRALSLPTPEYPALAKQTRTTGLVKVDIVISETGKVESAKATSGSPMLRQASVDAALKAKFAPTLKAGAAVRVTGFLQYEFKLS